MDGGVSGCTDSHRQLWESREQSIIKVWIQGEESGDHHFVPVRLQPITAQQFTEAANLSLDLLASP